MSLTVAERIADSLKAAIMKGRLKPGDALPSERELAERYDVNRSSVREAVKRLQGWGLVQVKHGGATRVRDLLIGAGLNVLPSLVELGNVDPGIFRELHELRGMLLGWCAERAASLATPADVANLEALVEKLADPKAKPQALQVLDYDFFDALVALTGNRLLAVFSSLVRDVYLRTPERFVSLYRRGVFDVGNHEKAVSAIRSKNARAAGDAMRAHAATALKAHEKEQQK
ncbi:MAG: FadR family transcriptional regulator [Myxococcaceae bacterium]|nr:FadR family transcriptional regulator [Myxococcaceae bacterium]